MKQKPLYWKSTHFAASIQYLNFLIECIIFPLALVLYIEHYNMDRDPYQNWDYYPITNLTITDSDECQNGFSISFTYDFPGSSTGCNCNLNDESEEFEFDYEKFKTGHCQPQELDEGCVEIDPTDGILINKWQNYTICGQQSTQTYRQLFYQTNCKSICQGVCTANDSDKCGNYSNFQSSQNKSESYYYFSLGYGNTYCYSNGLEYDKSYPLLEIPYNCDINSTQFTYIQSENYTQLLIDSGYNISNLKDIQYYNYNNISFGLFGMNFSQYNCSLPQLDISNYRDNYIQIMFLVALIMSGCLIGFGAIFHSAIIQNLTRKGIFKHKIYQVTWKFYCPTTFLILLHLAHLSIVGTKLGFLGHFRTTMKNFIAAKCTDWSSVLDIEYTIGIIDNELMPKCIPELLLTFIAMLLEILQLCLFDRRLPEKFQPPKLKERDSPGRSQNFMLNFGIQEDNFEKQVLDTENIRINSKNEHLKLFNQ